MFPTRTLKASDNCDEGHVCELPASYCFENGKPPAACGGASGVSSTARSTSARRALSSPLVMQPAKRRRTVGDDADGTAPPRRKEGTSAPPTEDTMACHAQAHESLVPLLQQLRADDPYARRKARKTLSNQSPTVLRGLFSHHEHWRSITDLLFLHNRYVIQLEAADLLTKKFPSSIIAEQPEVVAALIRAVKCFAENNLQVRDVEKLFSFVTALPVEARCSEITLEAVLCLLQCPQCEHLQVRVLRQLLLPIVWIAAEKPGVALSVRRHLRTWEDISKTLLRPSAPDGVAHFAKRVQESLYADGGAGRVADRMAFNDDFQ